MAYSYCLPARSKIPFLDTFKYLFFKTNSNLETEFTHCLGGKDVYCCNSWVGALALFLYELGKQEVKKQVILPRYSCYEFTMAIKIARLIPVFIDIDPDLRMSIPQLRATINKNTLAIIGVNNVGVFSDLESISKIADNKICFIEDATYTLFSKYRGHNASTIGDIAILNFSEGKAIPIGGGAVVLNNENYRSAFKNCKDWILAKPRQGNLKGLLDLLIYYFGSSIFVYSAYQILKDVLKINLKEKMSMEIIRRDPDSVRNQIDKDDIKANYDLLDKLTGKISKIKHYVAISKINNSTEGKVKRYLLAKRYLSCLVNNKKIKGFNICDEMYIIRLPILCDKINSYALEKHRSLGISRLYGPNSELNIKSAKEINSLLFYDNLLTLPVYETINENIIRKIIAALDEITK